MIAAGTKPPERDILLGHKVAGGKFPTLGRIFIAGVGKFDVGDMAALRAVKVTMLQEVGAKPRRLPVHMNGTDQTTPDHGLQTVVDGCQGNRGHLFLSPKKDLRGGRVIPFFHEHFVDMAPLGRLSQTAATHYALVGGKWHRNLSHWQGGEITPVKKPDQELF
jgi:hypothetical protein